ncbi:hybrid sensor histidine kinase/response regulator [Pararhodobacter oceanensis]|uniref:histidine kinase n=1 Tax=Pararhodobacter oceanensis TaxID=2172121 RepID=A0A2T8HQ93_9RHOB|nr:ATP-binding protein [Pararhodobacter oceanensis]PVH27617.1 hybrid sensor histidine kinase/response regulator [Pararhodobacter oceanensis]
MPHIAPKTDPKTLPKQAANGTRSLPEPAGWAARLEGRWLIGFGLLFVGLALAAMVIGAGSSALILGAMGASLVVLGGAALIIEARNRKAQGDLAAVMARATQRDPEPVLITDGKGNLLSANGAADGWVDPAEALTLWCVNPDEIAAMVLSDVLAHGQAIREYTRKDSVLHLAVHTVDEARTVLVWRFSMRQIEQKRDLDSLGVPIITLEAAGLSGNLAARALGGTEVLADLVAALAEAEVTATGGAFVTLADGQRMQAVRLKAASGRDDIILLPQASELAVQDPSPMLDYEEIPVALLQLDPAGKISGTNRLARTLLGLSASDEQYFWQVVEGLGRPVSDWLADARAGRALGRPEILRASLTGTETYVQIILRRASGPTNSDALVAVISDATELKSLEARFVQSQKMQAIGQLAGGVAHDFNNLLTAISGHCDLLLLNRDRFDPDYNDLLQIHQNSNRAAALVRQLLAFSRKQTMRPENLSLESLLEDLTHLLTRLVGERIVLTLSHDRSIRGIRADRRQLEQVIMNLVVNARDAMPMGGEIRLETHVKILTTEQDHGRVQLPAGRYATIKVIDEGIGIPKEIIDKIFEPFFSTKRLGEGTGLGLSTAYGIVKQMGGYIFANSVEGSGTEFTLYFACLPDDAVLSLDKPTPPRPVAADSEAAAAALTTSSSDQSATRLPPPDEGLKGGTILLVEDEAPVRAFAARALRLQGYQVFEAADGEQALEFLEDSTLRIDLFVTDVIMPGIDGPGWVAQALRTRPGTPVVFVSGYTEDTLSAALSHTPKAVFLGKPFSLGELNDTINQQLEA